jgi:PAS domain S-box-containing protein
MSTVGESTARISQVVPTASPSEIPGDVQAALADVNVPGYVVDRFGIIRWLNPAAERLVGDVRGRQQSSVVAPEYAREAKESFTRKVLGTEKATDATVVLLDAHGTRVQVEISSCPLYEGNRIVGVFGLVPHREAAAPPDPHPHLTPRQNQILHLLSHGRSTAQIAEELSLSTDTVRNHVRRMLRALGAHSRIEALAVAHREGILRPDRT